MGGVGGTIYFNLPFNFKREGPLYFIQIKKTITTHQILHDFLLEVIFRPPTYITMYPKSLIKWTTPVLADI